MSRHARENPELYENPGYDRAADLHRQADDLREQWKMRRAAMPNCPDCHGDGGSYRGADPPRWVPCGACEGTGKEQA